MALWHYLLHEQAETPNTAPLGCEEAQNPPDGLPTSRSPAPLLAALQTEMEADGGHGDEGHGLSLEQPPSSGGGCACTYR